MRYSQTFSANFHGFKRVRILPALLILGFAALWSTPIFPVLEESKALEESARKWKAFEASPTDFEVREMFALLLESVNFGEDARKQLVLLKQAAEAQETRESHSNFGHYRWKTSAKEVEDYNAVQFSMQAAVLIPLLMGDKLDPEVKTELLRQMKIAARAVLSQDVSIDYSNIFLMKIWNLCALGKILGDAALLRQGETYFEKWLVRTSVFGPREYNSPTYTPISLESINLLAKFGPTEKLRNDAALASELLWREILAQYFAPGKMLSGPNARNYSYVHGLGRIDPNLRAAGFSDQGTNYALGTFISLAFLPPSLTPEIKTLLTSPRKVEHRWGHREGDVSVNEIGETVTLGSTSAPYGPDDKVLTFSFSGNAPRFTGSVVVEGREDPFGQNKVAAGAHQKARHLRPFFGAVQNQGAVLYALSDDGRERGDTRVLALHLLLPAEARYFQNQNPVSVVNEITLESGDCLFFRYGSAAVAIRPLLALSDEGKSVSFKLVNEGVLNPVVGGALRLTAALSSGKPKRPAQAAFWLKVLDKADEASFNAFQKECTSVKASASFQKNVLSVESPGLKLALDTQKKNLLLREGGGDRDSFLLRVNGREIGRDLLMQIPSVASWWKALPSGKTALSFIQENQEKESP